MRKIISLSAICAVLFFASCGGNNNQNNESDTTGANAMETPATAPEETSGANATDADNQVTDHINLTGDDHMQYNDTLFKVKAGQEITLDMKNIGELPAAAMSHNVVILKPGSSVNDYGNAAVNAKDEGYIPSDKSDEVIAHTKMLGPGESDQITFKLPEAGRYPFLCSFPGHHLTMHGTIIAEK